MPQLKSGTPATAARVTGVAISRAAANPDGAEVAAQVLSGKNAIGVLTTVSPLPPVRRDVGVDTSASASAATFARSALIARTWLDPGPASDVVFKDMIESVLSGKNDPSQAVFDGAAGLAPLLEGKY